MVSSPPDLALQIARRVMANPPEELGTGWPLAVTILSRQALEEAIERFWAGIEPANSLSGIEPA